MKLKYYFCHFQYERTKRIWRHDFHFLRNLFLSNWKVANWFLKNVSYFVTICLFVFAPPHFLCLYVLHVPLFFCKSFSLGVVHKWRHGLKIEGVKDLNARRWGEEVKNLSKLCDVSYERTLFFVPLTLCSSVSHCPISCFYFLPNPSIYFFFPNFYFVPFIPTFFHFKVCLF